MFYLDPKTNKRYHVGRAFEYEGYYYGTVLATDEKFAELEFTPVSIGPRPDDDYYEVSGPDDTGAYTATPRDLDKLKATFKLKQKKVAHNALRQTDWYVIRSTELGVIAAAVPTNISEFRTAYRTASDVRCAEIDACTTVEELETLMKAPRQLLDASTGELSVNPAALSPWPTPLSEEAQVSVY